MRMRTAGWMVVLALACAATLMAVDLRERVTTIEGHVYLTGVGQTARPVAGATIATDQSSETTTTDSDGKFTLRIRRIAPDEFVVVTAWTADKFARQRRLTGYGPNIHVNLELQ